MAIFGNNFIIIHKSWADLKTTAATKNLVFQYDLHDDIYQIFIVDGVIVYLTTIYDGTVPDNSSTSQFDNDQDKTDFLNNYANQNTLPSGELDKNRAKMTEVNFRKGDIEQTTYYILIDKSNPDGYYKHMDVATGGIKIGGMHSAILKNKIADAWTIRLGIVLSVDSEQCRIAWSALGTLAARSAGDSQETLQQFIYPLFIDCTVNNGELLNMANNHVEVTTDINTTTPIEDASNIYRVVQPGDVIIRPTLFSGSGSIVFHYHIWYLVE